MCLAVPGRVEEVFVQDDMLMARVDFEGIKRSVCLQCVEAKVGDYVLVHVGFAISVIDQAEAEKTLELLRASGELDEIGE